MSEKRFKSTLDEDTMSIMPYLVSDKEEECFYNLQGCVDLLNEQSERIKSLEMELDLIANTKLFSRRKLEEENEQMKKQLEQIPKSIREVWLE